MIILCATYHTPSCFEATTFSLVVLRISYSKKGNVQQQCFSSWHCFFLGILSPSLPQQLQAAISYYYPPGICLEATRQRIPSAGINPSLQWSNEHYQVERTNLTIGKWDLYLRKAFYTCGKLERCF